MRTTTRLTLIGVRRSVHIRTQHASEKYIAFHSGIQSRLRSEQTPGHFRALKNKYHGAYYFYPSQRAGGGRITITHLDRRTPKMRTRRRKGSGQRRCYCLCCSHCFSSSPLSVPCPFMLSSVFDLALLCCHESSYQSALGSWTRGNGTKERRI